MPKVIRMLVGKITTTPLKKPMLDKSEKRQVHVQLFKSLLII